MLKLIWKICTFQAKPSEIPYSLPLLGIKIFVNLAVLILILTLATNSLSTATIRSVIFVGLIAIYSFVLLYHYDFTERFVQVLSGLLSAMAIILITLAIPYVIILVFLADTTTNSVYFGGLAVSSLLLMIAGMWLYVVYARIYKHALEISINQGLFASLGLFVICGALFFLL